MQHPSKEQSELITHLFNLFIRCPFGQAAGNCPFADIRALRSLELKFQLAEKMAMHPQCPKNVHDTHDSCYRERLSRIVSEKSMPDGTQNATRARLSPAAGQPR